MKRVKTRKNKKSIIFRLALLIFIGWVVYILVSLQLELADRKKEYVQLENEYSKLVTSNLELQDAMDNGTDRSYLVRRARELGLVFPHESVFVDISGK